MKKWLAIILMLCLLAGAALAEENALPVLVAQLGKAAVMVDMYEAGDEYTEVLAVDTAVVIMGRYAGEKPAEEIAAMYGDDFYDTMPLAHGDAVSERGAYLFTDGMDNWVVDTTVIHLDGYTYAFSVVLDENSYFGYLTDDPLSEQVDWWVSTLDVFDGTPAAAESDAAGYIMMLFDSPLMEDAELFDAQADENGYSYEYVAADGKLRMGEYSLPAGEDDAQSLQAAVLAAREDATDVQWQPDDIRTAELGWSVYTGSWRTDDACARAMAVTGPQTLLLFVSAAEDEIAAREAEIDALFAGVEIYSERADVDAAALTAEEIAYALFGDYMAFDYVMDQEIYGEGWYSVYEFYDDTDAVIGTIAVDVQTGSAYAAFGMDALSAEYEAVITGPDGYSVAESVG